MGLPAGQLAVDTLELLEGLAPGVAANDIGGAAAAEGLGGASLLARGGATAAAAIGLGLFAGQVHGLANDLFAEQDANANALARAAAAARPGAGGSGREPPDGPNCEGRKPRHHVFPQEFRAQFEEAGIDIDDFTIEMSEEGHAGLHGPGEWNGNWDEFLNGGPARTPEEILDYATEMLNSYGLQNEPMVPYY